MKVLGVASFVFLVGLTPGDAHWKYSPYCCDSKDCEPVGDDDIEELPDGSGFKVKGIEGVIPRKDARVQTPLDDRNHICKFKGQPVRCIYPKSNGT